MDIDDLAKGSIVTLVVPTVEIKAIYPQIGLVTCQPNELNPQAIAQDVKIDTIIRVPQGYFDEYLDVHEGDVWSFEQFRGIILGIAAETVLIQDMGSSYVFKLKRFVLKIIK